MNAEWICRQKGDFLCKYPCQAVLSKIIVLVLYNTSFGGKKSIDCIQSFRVSQNEMFSLRHAFWFWWSCQLLNNTHTKGLWCLRAGCSVCLAIDYFTCLSAWQSSRISCNTIWCFTSRSKKQFSIIILFSYICCSPVSRPSGWPHNSWATCDFHGIDETPVPRVHVLPDKQQGCAGKGGAQS